MYEKICPVCGTKLSDYFRSGYLGCENCYKEFEREITASLKEIQGGSVHVGKKPRLCKIDKELLSEYQMYLKQKEVAALEKRFADMAKINGILSDLSEELKRRGLIK